VLIEDTGLSDWLAVGEGVVTFSNPVEAVTGIESINAKHARHRTAARRLAAEVFSTDKVLASLLVESMN
jgi:hypothetical protein